MWSGKCAPRLPVIKFGSGMTNTPSIIEFGEYAFLVNFDPVISLKINEQVHRLDALVRDIGGRIITFTIPAYTSLTVGFAAQREASEVRSVIDQALARLKETTEVRASRNIEVPVCFHESFSPDKARICEITGMDWNEITTTLCQGSFRVYMIGFVAGFPYLGKLPEYLRCPRLERPRSHVARGSVAIAEMQCGIYPTDTPGGWNIVGRTPLDLVRADDSDPFLFHPSDHVSFVEITLSEFDQIQLQFSSKA